jgi:membrane protein DedA with SNARE-associated domain
MQQLLDFLQSLSPGSVYGAIAGVLLACGLGIPIPEDITLISGGYLAHLGVVNVHKVLAVSFGAVLTGDAFAFLLGRWAGQRLLQTQGLRRLFSPRRQLRVRAYFRKYGSKVVFVARFLPGLRASIFFSAGMLHVRLSTFVFWDGLAAVLSVPALVYLAFTFGEHIDHVVRWARRSEWGLVVVVAAVVVVVFAKWRRDRRRARALGDRPGAVGADPPPTGT